MNYTCENGILTIAFPENVTSANADEVSGELFGILEKVPAVPVHIDLTDTVYISSAGLRVLLKLQKSGREVLVKNASSEVYEIFEITGFSDIMNIQKRRRQFSVAGAKLIGEGYSSKVYRITDDSIIKVFIRNTSLADIERELNLAKKAFVLGIPTAISYDVVDVDGKLGLVFELIHCGLLRDALLDAPNEFDDYMRKYVSLLISMNTTDVENTALPNMKDIYANRLHYLQGRIGDADYAEVADFLQTVPDGHTFVHGDCHIKNIMYSGKELLLIDMDTLSYGSPLFELAQIYSSYILFPQVYIGNSESFFGIPHALAERMMDSIFSLYFAHPDAPIHEGTLYDIKRLAHIYFMFFFAEYEPDDTESFQKAYALYRQFVDSIK